MSLKNTENCPEMSLENRCCTLAWYAMLVSGSRSGLPLVFTVELMPRFSKMNERAGVWYVQP